MAIIEASKRKTRRKYVKAVLENLDYYAADLSKRFETLDFTSPYRPRIITDGLSGKVREIQVPAFYPDQCAHHAIIRVLQPHILKSSYYWSCANLPRRGIDHASKGVTRATIKDQKRAKYCVKCDIQKFYPSIPHDKLKAFLRRKIKDKRAIELLDVIVDSFDHGLPIGNYTSPWLAEWYLQSLDRVVKNCGVRHYIRYADDTVLIDSNKRKLRRALKAMMAECDRLGLQLKGNYQLFRVTLAQKERKHRHGRKIDFVGKCFALGYTTVRKKRALVFMRQSRHIQKLQAQGIPIPRKTAAGFLSRSSCLRKANTFGLRKKYYETVNIKQLKEVVRRESKRQCQSECA